MGILDPRSRQCLASKGQETRPSEAWKQADKGGLDHATSEGQQVPGSNPSGYKYKPWGSNPSG